MACLLVATALWYLLKQGESERRPPVNLPIPPPGLARTA